jgi:hypothetical protein
MALIEVDPVDDPLDDLIHWGAVEDNVGGLSPDLQGEPGASVGQGGLDLLGDPTADMCDTTGMSGALEFLARPLALVGVGVIWLLVAASALVSGGGVGMVAAIMLTFAGGRSIWRGFTKWRAESGPT